MRVAVVPSNQNHNIAGGDPNPAPGPTTEEQIWTLAAKEAVAEFIRQGHTAQMFWVAGAGTASVDELLIMMDQVMAWKPDHSLSLHSNVGSGVQLLYPLMGLSNDTGFATTYGKDAAARLGFTFRNPTYRTDLTYFTHTKVLGAGRTLLSETGEHQTATSAAWLWKYARYDGIMCARAFIKACGVALKSDGPVPSDVVVPAGASFDKYRPGAVTPPIPGPPVVTLPTLAYTTGGAYMKDNVTGTVPAPINILQYPIHWLQAKLNEQYDGQHKHAALPALVVDGVFGQNSKDRVLKFQSEHYDIQGVHLVSSGTVEAKTWAKLRTV